MRYSLEPRQRKYVEEYGFLPLQENFGINMVKRLMDTSTKTGIDAAKAASKMLFKKLRKLEEI